MPLSDTGPAGHAAGFDRSARVGFGMGGQRWRNLFWSITQLATIRQRHRACQLRPLTAFVAMEVLPALRLLQWITSPETAQIVPYNRVYLSGVREYGPPLVWPDLDFPSVKSAPRPMLPHTWPAD